MVATQAQGAVVQGDLDIGEVLETEADAFGLGVGEHIRQGPREPDGEREADACPSAGRELHRGDFNDVEWVAADRQDVTTCDDTVRPRTDVPPAADRSGRVTCCS